MGVRRSRGPESFVRQNHHTRQKLWVAKLLQFMKCISLNDSYDTYISNSIKPRLSFLLFSCFLINYEKKYHSSYSSLEQFSALRLFTVPSMGVIASSLHFTLLTIRGHAFMYVSMPADSAMFLLHLSRLNLTQRGNF